MIFIDAARIWWLICLQLSMSTREIWIRIWYHKIRLFLLQILHRMRPILCIFVLLYQTTTEFGQYFWKSPFQIASIKFNISTILIPWLIPFFRCSMSKYFMKLVLHLNFDIFVVIFPRICQYSAHNKYPFTLKSGICHKFVTNTY